METSDPDVVVSLCLAPLLPHSRGGSACVCVEHLRPRRPLTAGGQRSGHDVGVGVCVVLRPIPISTFLWYVVEFGQRDLEQYL